MSLSNALQKLVYDRLTSYAPLAALVGARIYDHPPLNATFPYISFGPSDYVPDDMDCITGRVETLQIDIWSRAQDGKRECKAITDAVKSALHLFEAEPEAGALVLMTVGLVRVLDDPDQITSHGIVQIEATMEE